MRIPHHKLQTKTSNKNKKTKKTRCNIERSIAVVYGAGLNLSMYGRHVWLGDTHMRVERASLIEVKNCVPSQKPNLERNHKPKPGEPNNKPNHKPKPQTSGIAHPITKLMCGYSCTCTWDPCKACRYSAKGISAPVA